MHAIRLATPVLTLSLALAWGGPQGEWLVAGGEAPVATLWSLAAPPPFKADEALQTMLGQRVDLPLQGGMETASAE